MAAASARALKSQQLARRSGSRAQRLDIAPKVLIFATELPAATPAGHATFAGRWRAKRSSNAPREDESR